MRSKYESGTSYGTSSNQAINDKMQVLDDFGICKKDDKIMRKNLKRAIEEQPNRDPREVLDYYCRPIVQAVVNSWL